MHYRANEYVLSKRLKHSALIRSGLGWNPGESSRLWGRRLKRHGGRKCWDGSEVLQVADGWRNADAAELQHWRPGRSSPTSTVVRGRSDTDELTLSAWRTPGRGRRASEVRRSVSDPGRGQTSECRWRRAQQRSTHAVICPLLSLVRQQEQCCSNQSVNSQIHNGVDECSQRVRVQRQPETVALNYLELRNDRRRALSLRY